MSWEKEQDEAKQRGEMYLSDEIGCANTLRQLLLKHIYIPSHTYVIYTFMPVDCQRDLVWRFDSSWAKPCQLFLLAMPALGQGHKLISFIA